MKVFFTASFAWALCTFMYWNNTALAQSHHVAIDNSAIVTIDSKVLGRKYDLLIKVPKDYGQQNNRAKKYPVLFLNDGPYTFKVAAGVTHMKQMDKVIIVGISFAKGQNGQYSRVRDLTPEEDTSWTKYETGGAPRYLQFIEDEVFTYVENNYRVNTNQRILSGQSLGGSFGAWVLLSKPELFSSYILTSPSLWYKNDLIYNIEHNYHARTQQLNANVYIATGALETKNNGMNNDMAVDQTRFVNHLHARNYQGLTLVGEIIDGTDHYSTFPVGLSKGLMFVYEQLKLH
ncbi:alpha/beta hydrolase [Thalassotalea maritima]|uniref:alpha/beta hydrolase n=1 Tax=Thalassotalea maritima TaxID=3242416 RepID=UPI0035287603